MRHCIGETLDSSTFCSFGFDFASFQPIVFVSFIRTCVGEVERMIPLAVILFSCGFCTNVQRSRGHDDWTGAAKGCLR